MRKWSTPGENNTIWTILFKKFHIYERLNCRMDEEYTPILQRNVIVLEYNMALTRCRLRGAHKACPSPEIGTAYSI